VIVSEKYVLILLICLTRLTLMHPQFQLVRPINILCDGENQRLRLTNFGNAVDLDPPRIGLDNDSLELDVPGSIANTLAADVFSVALILCQLMFGYSDNAVLNQQLKDVGYDLDLWLQKAHTAEESRPSGFSEALEYLEARPGLWSLLKGTIRPNPMRKVRDSGHVSFVDSLQAHDYSHLVFFSITSENHRRFFEAIQ